MEEGRAKPKVILSPEQALKRAQRYCAYQERSQQEVRDKLYSWGLHRREVESLLVELISDGFLKEERFAHAFAGGKFRIKKWGRVRIEQALKGSRSVPRSSARPWPASMIASTGRPSKRSSVPASPPARTATLHPQPQSRRLRHPPGLRTGTGLVHPPRPGII